MGRRTPTLTGRVRIRRIGDTTPTAEDLAAAAVDLDQFGCGDDDRRLVLIGRLQGAIDVVSDLRFSDESATRAVARARAVMTVYAEGRS